MHHHTHQKRVVLVDDDPIVQQAIRVQLEAHGMHVVVADTGPEGYERIREIRPGLCIVDWMLPGMDGLDLVREVRRDSATRGVYVIMLTARNSPAELREAFEAGVDDFLGKSPNTGEFTSRLRAAMRIIELQQELKQQFEEVSNLNSQLVELNCQLQAMATTDALTGLSNRRDTLEKLGYLWQQWTRHRAPLCVAFVDIDHFKRINDTHGHDAGDDVLRHFAGLLSDDRRVTEVIGRYGGEEFVLGMPLQTLHQAVTAMERLREHVQFRPILASAGDVPVTVSIGVAQSAEWMTSLDDLVRAADKALYTAKRTGRNRVCVADAIELARHA